MKSFWGVLLCTCCLLLSWELGGSLCTPPLLLRVPSFWAAWRPASTCVYPASSVPVSCSPSQFTRDFLICTLTTHSLCSGVYARVFLLQDWFLAHCLHVRGTLHSPGLKDLSSEWCSHNPYSPIGHLMPMGTSSSEGLRAVVTSVTFTVRWVYQWCHKLCDLLRVT